MSTPQGPGGDGADRPLPAKAAETTAENPWPVRLLAQNIKRYIDRMSEVWIEGQVVQLNRRGSKMAFLQLRDTDVEASLPVHVYGNDLPPAELLTEGAHVVVRTKADFWPKSGRLSMHGREIRALGVGELLARIEHLKRVLEAEGLFDPRRKRPLPFLPRRIGLITGRDSAAEHDVLANVRLRWPQAQFAIREVAVQGASAVQEVTRALRELDADPDVDVIVIARGGGSVEDLLPFSNETLVRAVSAVFTPVISAIGHEPDTPLLDFVADLRASTPTDAAKRVVPDVVAERAGIADTRARMRQVLTGIVARERENLARVRQHPVLAHPEVLVTRRSEEVARLRDQGRRVFGHTVSLARADLRSVRASLHALSPAATLDRGYSVLRRRDGSVVRDAAETAEGERLEALLASGRLGVEVIATAPATARDEA